MLLHGAGAAWRLGPLPPGQHLCETGTAGNVACQHIFGGKLGWCEGRVNRGQGDAVLFIAGCKLAQPGRT
jgi:hypothetical protein